MKTAVISALVASFICALALGFKEMLERDNDSDVDYAVVARDPAPAPSNAVVQLQFADALIEDVWVNAARQPGSDRRTLTSAADSVCYLTKVEISGIQGPEDSSSCAIEIDDFTSFWQLVATADEGGRSEIRCNARCFSLTVSEALPDGQSPDGESPDGESQ